MYEPAKASDRDDVLIAFHNKCDKPTSDDIANWVSRYPQFEDDIRAHAAIRNEWAELDSGASEVDETTLARGRSNALNLLHQVQQAERQQAASNEQATATWANIVQASGFDIPILARTLNIDRMVLAELNAGRMRLPIGKRLFSALSDVLNVSASKLSSALTLLVSGPPRLSHAKANGSPVIHTRSYEEIVQASTMTPVEKSYWLTET
jgi:hypothetical protein